VCRQGVGLCGEDDDVGVGLAIVNNVGHVGGGSRRADVGDGGVGGVEHEVWGRVENFVVDDEDGAVGEHVDDAGFGGCFEFARFVAIVESGFDFVLRFAFGALVLDEKAGEESCGGAFGVEAGGLAVEGILAIDDAGETIGAIADFDVAGGLEGIDGGFAGDFGRSGALGKLNFFVAREREVVGGLGLFGLGRSRGGERGWCRE